MASDASSNPSNRRRVFDLDPLFIKKKSIKFRIKTLLTVRCVVQVVTDSFLFPVPCNDERQLRLDGHSRLDPWNFPFHSG